MILLSYDGSDGADAAIDEPARLMSGSEVTVLCVRETRVDALSRSGAPSAGAGALTGCPDGDEVDAGLIVLGTFGLGAVECQLPGSVSHAVVRDADRPVLVVPCPATLTSRGSHRTAAAVAA